MHNIVNSIVEDSERAPLLPSRLFVGVTNHGPRAPARTPGKSFFPGVPPNHRPGEGSADPTRQAGTPPARAADRSLSSGTGTQVGPDGS